MCIIFCLILYQIYFCSFIVTFAIVFFKFIFIFDLALIYWLVIFMVYRWHCKFFSEILLPFVSYVHIYIVTYNYEYDFGTWLFLLLFFSAYVYCNFFIIYIVSTVFYCYLLNSLLWNYCLFIIIISRVKKFNKKDTVNVFVVTKHLSCYSLKFDFPEIFLLQ